MTLKRFKSKNGCSVVLWMASASGVVLLNAVAAHAQTQSVLPDQQVQAAQTEAPVSNGDPTEVIVTATKRASSLQKVPVSVGVVTGETMEIKGIDRAIDAALQVPSVVFQQTDEARTASISIRGVGSNGVSEGFEPSVSTIIDGEVYARTTSLTQSFADVDRVEVLRGPQGTLFGKNTSAGAVSITTRRPRLGEESAQLQLRGAEHGEVTTKGYVNFPVATNAAVRINAFKQSIDGWLDNAAPGQPKIGNSKANGIRGQLLFEPNEQWTVILRADYSESRSHGNGTIWLSTANTPAGTTIRNILTSFNQPIGPDADVASVDGTQFSDITNRGVSLDVAYTFNGYEFRSQTFKRFNRLDENRDQDATPIISGPKRFYGFVLSDTLQQEFRLTSPKWAWGDYIAGAFYYNADTSRDGANQTCTQMGTLTPDTGGTHLSSRTYYDPVTLKVSDCQGAGTSPYNTVNDFSTAVVRDNWALFGNVNFNVSDRLKLFLGARYLEEETSIRFSSSQAPTTSLTNPFRNSRTDDAFIGRVGGQYFFSDDVNVYASYATGYKGPTFNDTGGSTPESLSLGGDDYLEPEHSRQLELGLRSQWFSRKFTFNLTAYRLEVDDFQERISRFVDLNGDGTPDDLETVTVNAGQVATRGLEWDTTWRTPIKGLTIGYNGAYTDAYYADFGENLLPCPDALVGTSECFHPTGTPGTSQFIDPQGRPLPRSPKWQHFTDIAYRTELAGGSLINLGATYRWQSKFNFETNQDPFTVQRSYGLLDLTAGWTDPTRKYNLNLVVNNATDQRYYSSILSNAAGFGGGYRAGLPRAAMRFVGVNLRVNF